MSGQLKKLPMGSVVLWIVAITSVFCVLMVVITVVSTVKQRKQDMRQPPEIYTETTVPAEPALPQGMFDEWTPDYSPDGIKNEST